MTSSLHRNFRCRAFTLIEMMVVIGLIVVLVAFAIPMVSRAHRASVRTAMAADLAIIANGLEAYRSDFGDYPRMGGGLPVSGANLLCWALVAPGPAGDPVTRPPGTDGADGPGFRTRGLTGAVKGPYLPTDRFTMGNPTFEPMVPPVLKSGPVEPQSGADPAHQVSDAIYMIGDRYLHPILYFPANKAADPYSTSVVDGAYVSFKGSPSAMFNYSDNHTAAGSGSFLALDKAPNKMSQAVMCWRLGATSKQPYPDGNLYPADTPVTTGPFLLWSAGTDGLYGTNDDLANAGSEVQLNVARVPDTFPVPDQNPNPQVQ